MDFGLLHTNCKLLSYCNANSYSDVYNREAAKKIYTNCIYWKVCYHGWKLLAIWPYPKPDKFSLHEKTPHWFKINFNVTVLSTYISLMWGLFFFSNKILHNAHLSSVCYMPSPSYPAWCDYASYVLWKILTTSNVPVDFGNFKICSKSKLHEI